MNIVWILYNVGIPHNRRISEREGMDPESAGNRSFNIFSVEGRNHTV
jgi:hypothetical protein